MGNIVTYDRNAELPERLAFYKLVKSSLTQREGSYFLPSVTENPIQLKPTPRNPYGISTDLLCNLKYDVTSGRFLHTLRDKKTVMTESEEGDRGGVVAVYTVHSLSELLARLRNYSSPANQTPSTGSPMGDLETRVQ